MKPRYLTLSMMFALAVGLFNGVAVALDEGTDPAGTQAQATTETTDPAPDARPPATQPTTDQADQAAAEQAMNDLLGSRRAAPVIEPESGTGVQYPGLGTGGTGGASSSAGAAASVDIDPAVLGVAPGEDPPPLRREGEFIVNRRGRLFRSSEGGHLLFVFESDTQAAPELPMILQACQLLEAMEETVQRHGDTTVFILSGQVHAYRGANYLLPTMMKIAVDKGNLTN